MSQVQRDCNHCDVCGHEWLPQPGVVYSHCTSGKCRSRKWNQGGGGSDGRAPGNARDLSQSPAPEVAGSSPAPRSKLPSRQEPLPKRKTEFGRIANQIDAIVAEHQATHNPKTCRVYKCGMCAAKG